MHIPAKIGDTETALTKHSTDQIPFLQDCSYRKLVGCILCAFPIAAVLTYRIIQFYLHASIAPVFFHRPSHPYRFLLYLSV